MIVKQCIAPRKISLYLALFAMILGFMAHITPLWAKQGDGQAILICSAFGNRTVFVDNNGKEIPQAPQQSPRKQCVMCLNTGIDYDLPHMTQAKHTVLRGVKTITRIPLNNDHIQQNDGTQRNAIRAPPYTS